MATKSIQQIRKEQSDFHNACVNGDLRRILQKDSSYSMGKERQLQEFDMRLKLGKEPRIAYDVNFVMADDVRQLYESLLESYLTTLRDDLKRAKDIATETEKIQQKIRNVETRIQVSHIEKQRREDKR